MDEFEKYLWDMDDKIYELYGNYIESCETLDENEQDRLSNEYYKEKEKLINEIRNKTAEELSKRYNLNKNFCSVITKYMGIDCDFDNTLSADFLDAKRYAEFARFVLNEHEKGDNEQFCDKKEEYVSENGTCYRFVSRNYFNV